MSLTLLQDGQSQSLTIREMHETNILCRYPVNQITQLHLVCGDMTTLSVNIYLISYSPSITFSLISCCQPFGERNWDSLINSSHMHHNPS